jgi:hypothetical protein
MTVLPMSIRCISLVPSKIVKIVDERAVSAGQRTFDPRGISTDPAPDFLGWRRFPAATRMLPSTGTRPKRAPQPPLTALGRELRQGTSNVYSRADLPVPRRPGNPPVRRWRAGGPYTGRTAGECPPSPGDRCRADRAASRTGQARITPIAPARRPARRAGTISRVSESFPELAQAVLEHAQPDRIDIVRAKRHLLGQLGDGQPHPTGTLIASVATLLGAERLGRPQIALPSRDSVKTVVSGLFICTQDHDQRQRCLRGLPLTEHYYPVGLTAAKPFRSPNPASVEAQTPDVGPERGSAVTGGGRR